MSQGGQALPEAELDAVHGRRGICPADGTQRSGGSGRSRRLPLLLIRMRGAGSKAV